MRYMKNVIVVGSGAGGATVARELAISGIDVTLLEKGSFITTENAYQCYDNLDVGVELLKTTCLGGTTLVTAGNAMRTHQGELESFGISMESEFLELEDELDIAPLPETHFGEGTLKIMDAASSIGLSMDKMPKFINPLKCIPCGKCSFGCPRNAKWSSLNYLEEAKDFGANIIENSPVTRIIVNDRQISGVISNGHEYHGEMVIVCAGAVETPKLLGTAGLAAGKHLFVDTFVTVGGVFKGIDFNREVSMNALYKGDGFILAPHYSGLVNSRIGGNGVSEGDILGMMVKIKDESSGCVGEGRVIKNNTSHDLGLLAEGSSLAGAILTEAGVDPGSLVSTPARGAHPGGTAAIGEVVDENLETGIDGLFVCDASVFPNAPGAPPILTILALAKRLSKYITRI